MSLANHRQETIPILKNCEPRKSFETTSYSFDESESALLLHPSSSSDDRRLAEKQFLLSCERGDIGSVRKLLAEPSPGFDLNCVDPLGRWGSLISGTTWELRRLKFNGVRWPQFFRRGKTPVRGPRHAVHRILLR